MVKVLFVLGSGGHTTRALILSEQLNYDKCYIVPWESEISKKRINGKYYSVLSPRFRAKDNKIMTVFRTLFLFMHSLFLLIMIRPDVLISTGSGITFPPFLIAKFLGIKTIFIESPSRVYEPSIAGKMLLGKTTLWISSWNELAKKNKEIVYGGLIV